MWVKDFPVDVFWSTKASPLLVAITTLTSSLIQPIISEPNISETSSEDIISPFLTKSGLSLFTSRYIEAIPSFSSKPIILSASLIAETSGVVTTTAVVAAALAFLNPCSIPAGQSIRI